MNPLRERPGRVASEGADHEVAAHYGDPLREQRMMARDVAIVDRGNRELVVVSGPDRLSWLHSITSQHLENLPAQSTIEGLVLSPHGHVEVDAWFSSIDDAVWIDTEPGAAAGLIEYLESMRFLLRVEVEERTDDFDMVTVIGPRASAIINEVFGQAPGPGEVVSAEQTQVRQPGDSGLFDVFGDRQHVADMTRRLLEAGASPAGLLAFDAYRIETMLPRAGHETDHRTIPHEIGLIGKAVHLNKGCYRGQETVARVHNLGRPPRRLVRLHLDGSLHTVPEAGSRVFRDGRDVGFVGTAAMHYEDGPVALAVIKRNVADGAQLTVRSGDDAEYAALVDSGLEV